jgi:hypothetical protein
MSVGPAAAASNTRDFTSLLRLALGARLRFSIYDGGFYLKLVENPTIMIIAIRIPDLSAPRGVA